jgi:hypothetical protein
MIPYPNTQQFKGVQFISDEGKYTFIRTKKWIIMAIRGAPTKEIDAGAPDSKS